MGRWSKHKSDWPPQNPIRLVHIEIINRQKKMKIGKSSARTLVHSTLHFLKVECEEVAVYFVTEKEITELHDQFFQDPTPTDCISFPLDKTHLGEIFVCPSVALAYATQKGLDPYKELSLYIVHGLLHLLGYDDLEAKARRTMRKKEKSCMGHLDKQKSILTSK